MSTDAGPEAAPDRTLTYADHACGTVDWHLPAGTDAAGSPSDGTPVVVVVHGGFWKARWDRTHTRAQARALADLGYAVATPEYRRVPSGLLDRVRRRADIGGGWPTTGDDVRAAVDAVPRMCAELGFEPGPLSAVGHSAGGQLVLWLAATGAALDHVVALAPVCDLREAIRLDLGDGAARALLREVDPSVADPMTLLDDRPRCPVTVVHGRDDEPVPVGLSRGLVERHPWLRYVEVGGGHMDLVTPGSATWPAVVEALSRGDG